MRLKRTENRALCAELIRVIWESEPGVVSREWAILGDISPSGACLEIDEPIAPDVEVTLEFGKERCRAIVQYCIYDRANYLLGVEFSDGYRWSSKRFVPSHLLQFRPRTPRVAAPIITL